MKKRLVCLFSVFLCACLQVPAFAETSAGAASSAEESAGTESTSSNDQEEKSSDIVQEGDNIKDVSEQNGDRTGVVTFVMDVPSDVTDPCVVIFTEVDSYEEYYAEAFKSANYTVTAYLEPGTYMVTDGYPVGDNVSAYSVQDKGYFIVESGGQQEVDIKIRSKGDVIRAAADKEDVQTADTATTEEVQEPEQPEEKDMRKLYAIAAAVLLVSGAAFMFILYKVLKKQRK